MILNSISFHITYLVLDKFLATVNDPIKPIFVTGGNITGFKPFIVCDGFLCCFGVVQVSLNKCFRNRVTTKSRYWTDLHNRRTFNPELS